MMCMPFMTPDSWSFLILCLMVASSTFSFLATVRKDCLISD